MHRAISAAVATLSKIARRLCLFGQIQPKRKSGIAARRSGMPAKCGSVRSACTSNIARSAAHNGKIR
eukprot:4367909-Prymnesium_polylepis.2